MEHADGGTLRDYLREHFNDLIWDGKFNLALQLAYAVSCLHDERIVHRDLVIYLQLLYDKIVHIIIFFYLNILYLIIAFQ